MHIPGDTCPESDPDPAQKKTAIRLCHQSQSAASPAACPAASDAVLGDPTGFESPGQDVKTIVKKGGRIGPPYIFSLLQSKKYPPLIFTQTHFTLCKNMI